MGYKMIKDNIKKILGELPPGVELVAAAKTRTSGEILEAIEAGVKDSDAGRTIDVKEVRKRFGLSA
jgi:hypothetical protein